MTETTTGQVDLQRLREALAYIPPGVWSEPSRLADNDIHHGYSRISLANGRRRMPGSELFGFALDAYDPILAAWLSRLEPGGFILPHQDGGPWFERWHIPIQAAGWFDDMEPEDGVPFRVEHWKPHALWNDSDRPRVHLVIDRDIPVDHPPVPFTVYPVPPERQAMVDRAK